MISDCIYDDIPPQMKNLNIVIPILMYFLCSQLRKKLRGHIGLGLSIQSSPVQSVCDA